MQLKQLTSLALGACLAACISSCGHSDYKTTNTGMKYDIISDGKGETLKHGDLIKIHFKMMVGDSLLEGTYGHIPGFGMVDSSMKDQHNFTDILTLMREGDSAIFIRSIDTLKKIGGIPLGSNFPPGATIKGYIKILKKFKDETAIRDDYSKEQAAELAREVSNLESYLRKNNINATKTPKGCFIAITKVGDGIKADSGKLITVAYKGTTLDGKVFDSSYDSTGNMTKPYEFTLGMGQAIQGWDECLKYLDKGGKATIYIPAMMAYGNQNQSDLIKPYTDLKFEVELVNIKDGSTTPAPSPHSH